MKVFRLQVFLLQLLELFLLEVDFVFSDELMIDDYFDYYNSHNYNKIHHDHSIDFDRNSNNSDRSNRFDLLYFDVSRRIYY